MVKENKKPNIWEEMLSKKQEKIIKLKVELSKLRAHKESCKEAELRKQLEKLRKKHKRVVTEKWEISLQKTYLRCHMPPKHLNCVCGVCSMCQFKEAEKQMALPPTERDESLLLYYPYREMYENKE